MYLSPFKWLELRYLTSKSYKFGIKMKNTSTCFVWYAYAFNWPNMKHFWKNWTFRSVQELVLPSVHISIERRSLVFSLHAILCPTSILVVTSCDSNSLSMSALFAFSLSCAHGLTHTQVPVLPLSSYVTILAQSVCKLAQETFRN